MTNDTPYLPVSEVALKEWLKHGPEMFGVALWDTGVLTGLCRVEVVSIGPPFFTAMGAALKANGFKVVSVNLSAEALKLWDSKLHKMTEEEHRVFFKVCFGCD